MRRLLPASGGTINKQWREKEERMAQNDELNKIRDSSRAIVILISQGLQFQYKSWREIERNLFFLSKSIARIHALMMIGKRIRDDDDAMCAQLDPLFSHTLF